MLYVKQVVSEIQKKKNTLGFLTISILRKNQDSNLSVSGCFRLSIYTHIYRDFPGGSVAKTPASNAGGLSSIPGQGTRSHMMQVRVRILQLKMPSAETKRSHISPATTRSEFPHVITRLGTAKYINKHLKYIYKDRERKAEFLSFFFFFRISYT